MTVQHYAKLLQIIGLLIGTGVVSILLNSEVVGAFAEKKLHGIRQVLGEIFEDGRYSLAQKLLMPKGGFPSRLKRQLILSGIIFIAWVLLIIGLAFHYTQLTWLSGLFLVSTCLWMIVDVLLLPRKNKSHKYSFGSIMFLLIMRLINVLILFPIIETILLTLIRVIYFIFVLIKSIAKINIYRFIFTLIGFILVLAGLIWEYILL
jgi:hypothetical protein